MAKRLHRHRIILREETDDDEPSVPQKIPKTIRIFDLIEDLKGNGRMWDIRRRAKALFTEKQHAMAILKVKSCNGAERFGIRFSEAWCGTETYSEELYSFGTIFLKGLELLEGIFESINDYEPLNDVDEKSTLAVKKLLSYLCDEDCIGFLENLKKKSCRGLNNETRLAVAVAEHLFAKLAVNSEYTLDRKSKFSTTENHCHCQCGCGTLVSDKFGDTSIGNSSVWHGSIDILVGNCEVPVIVANDPVIPGRRALEEDKYRAYHSIDSISTKSQMLAQTITFSFLQKKQHPDSTHFLVPCIGVTASQVMFYFYDSRHDLLLQSASMEFLDFSGSVRYDTIIALWLVLNYKYLGTGPSEKILGGPKSGFAAYAKDKEVLDIYGDFLTIGDIPVSENPEQFKPLNYLHAEFHKDLPPFHFLE